MDKKYKTTAGMTTAEAVNNVANEFAKSNEMLTTLFQMLMAEKAKSDARSAKYEAEEAQRKADEAKRQARYAAEEKEREEERKIDQMHFHLGQKIEILELGEKSDTIKVGDFFEVTKINIDHYDPEVTLVCGKVEKVCSEDGLKRAFKRGWMKLAE